MTKQEVIDNIYKLESNYGSYKSKCLRNLREYTYSPNITLSLTESEVVGYYTKGSFDVEDDTTSSIQENVINSAIDILTSRIASKKVRPFFNTVNGDFEDRAIVRNVQTYFDQLYDYLNVNKTVTEVFRNACIFDTGVVKLANKSITSELPWNVFIDNLEYTYGNLTRVAEKFEKLNERVVYSRYSKKLQPGEYTVYEYYDTYNHIQAVFIAEENYVEIHKYEPDELPYLFFHYTNPVKGRSCQSVVDLLYGIQLQIDEILGTIKDSIQMNPGVTYFVPSGSKIKVDMLSNRTGQIVQYDAIPGQSGTPVLAQTSAIIDPQFIQILEKLKTDAYEIVGLSELSNGQKPVGLNSGVALQTMEDIESDRFETQLNNVVSLYKNIAMRLIDILPEDDSILPEDNSVIDFTWRDVVEARDRFKIQYSAANSLSKDPSTKLQQLQSLANAGVIPQSHVAQLMELPDIQQGYNLANNAYNAVMVFIETVVKTGEIPETIPIYLPKQMLKDEITNTILSLCVKEGNKPIVELLQQLMQQVLTEEGNSLTNAEYAAVQQLNQELTQAMPQITQDATSAATNAAMEV